MYRIESIADHLELVPTIAEWHWTAFSSGHADPTGSLETWTAGLAERTNRDSIPTTYVALIDQEPVGSVVLVDNDMATHPELWPWLAGLYVVPEHRCKGIGSALVTYCEERAREMGVAQLYLYTSAAESLYRRLGWKPMFREHYEDVLATVLTKAPNG